MAKAKKVHKKEGENPVASVPGYITLTKQVGEKIWQEKRLFAKLLTLYVLVNLLLVGLVPQEDYRAVSDELSAFAGTNAGGGFVATMLLYGATASGSIGVDISGLSPQYGAAVAAGFWLVTIWLLRQRLSGKAVQLRDGLYSAMAPLISSALLMALGAIQLLPLAAGMLVFSAALSSGLLQGALVWVGAVAVLGLGLLSLYWLSATALSLIVVTLPGTYPLVAHRLARDIVAGRRAVIIGRLAWLAVMILVLSIVLLIPAILVDNTVRSEWLPLVPFMLQVFSASAVIGGATYMYLLYRGVIDGKEAA